LQNEERGAGDGRPRNARFACGLTGQATSMGATGCKQNIASPARPDSQCFGALHNSDRQNGLSQWQSRNLLQQQGV
jgi:hypothetical protein